MDASLVASGVVIGLAVVAVVVVVVVRFGLPRWRAKRRRQRWERDVEDSLADVADLLLVVLGAGAGVTQCLELVAARGPDVVRPAFAGVLERCAGGSSLGSSLPLLVDDLGPGYWPLVSALTAAVRDGVPMSSLLLRLGDEARAARRRSNERAARSLPVQMLFPLVCCSLPAVLVGAVVPLVLVAFGRL